MYRNIIYLLVFLFLLSGCKNEKSRPANNGAFAPAASDTKGIGADFEDIVASGELIVGTLNGPDTYYEYQGQAFGLQYALAMDFARREGLRLRVETAQDTSTLVKMLREKEVDIVALPLPLSLIRQEGFVAAGATDKKENNAWAVRADASGLASALDDWNTANPLVTVEKHEAERNRERRQVKRQVRAPYLSQQKGIISTYDAEFKKAASTTGWDWRLIAAQCYQESGFDPNAVSWAGARGLMQIMPSTARGIGVNPDDLFTPEKNIRAAARVINNLNASFSDIRHREERTKFVLAAYNGGPGHVRDAMALARKYGKNPTSWEDVSYYVLHLSEPQYYRDPVVKYGYMIGSETHGYVSAVLNRYRSYGGTVSAMGGGSGGEVPSAARPSRKPNRFTKERKILSAEELRSL